MAKIKYITETVSRWNNNGYTMAFGIITRTSDGAQLRIKQTSRSNLRSIILDNDPDNANYPNTYAIESEMKARDWNRADKFNTANGAILEHNRDEIAEWFGQPAVWLLMKRRCKDMLRNGGEDALMNPHAYTGQACGCGDCFCCAALEVAQERGIDLETWEPA